MKYNRPQPSRRGTIMPLLVITLVSLAALVALAVDIGMIAVARTQCQNAADAAAMTGARTLNGDTASNNNASQAQANATANAEANSVLGQPIQSNQVAIQIGERRLLVDTFLDPRHIRVEVAPVEILRLSGHAVVNKEALDDLGERRIATQIGPPQYSCC